MANVAKGGFPGCPRRKIQKRKKLNFNHRIQGPRWENNLTIVEQVEKNLRKFYEIFGKSDEDDDFHGFSSEECGLRAYKRVNSGKGDSAQIPDILCSPIDLTKKRVTTRLAHARNSLDALPSSQRTRRRKRTIVRRRYSKSEVPIVEGTDVPSEPLVRLQSIELQLGGTEDQGFTKYKYTNLDFHRLSEGSSFRDHSSSALRSSVSRPHKASPIKPATFIAPSMGNHNVHHVTNVTPTCLKIKINPIDEAGPGHPKVLAKALLARASRRGRKPKTSGLEQPVHTSTPIAAAATKPKPRSFVLPTKSSRSSRIIKANPKYLDSDTADTSRDNEPVVSPPSLIHHSSYPEQQTSESRSDSCHDSPSKGRPLLKEPTFRVAALANINNKPQPTRNLGNKGMSTRMRARKLIKRARFKHPTSSSTLVVGNDFEDDTDRKRNLIREATFKMPSHSSHQKAASDSGSEDLSDLGLCDETWEIILQNETKYFGPSPLWTKQEIHNILHGANTFHNSWTSVARHYEYHPVHRDWSSIRQKAKTLQNFGLLSENLKVKSSILLQLRHRYSSNPNVTVFTQRELKFRGWTCNVECNVGEKGRMIKNTDVEGGGKDEYAEIPVPQSLYLGLKKSTFATMCRNRKPTNKSWSVIEIHNILHGVHIFGAGEWSKIHATYVFHWAHDNLDIRARYRSLLCRNLVVAGKVKKQILPLLQPNFTTSGKNYFGIDKKDLPEVDFTKIEDVKDRSTRNESKTNNRKRNASTSESDLTSPPRKQTYHLFGTAPVWDDGGSASGLQSLKSGSEVEEDPTCDQILSTPNKSKERGRKTSSESTSSKKGKKVEKEAEDKSQSAKSKGPRIKHVCRRASLVTGHKPAVYSDDGAHLSALPKEEREKIAAEVEKQRGVPSDSTMSSDTEGEGVDATTLPKQAVKRKDKLRTTSIVRRKSERNNGTLIKDVVKKTVDKTTTIKRNLTPTLSETKPRSKSPSSNLPNHSVSAGIMLSPDSRRRLQHELHERDQHLPAVVKIDEWKERYELEDLWKMGGVGIMTSTTPSTRFICFLCGSVGKTRPMRRISANSESSLDSTIDNYVHTPLFIFCCCCCEPFHPFCLDDHEQNPAIADAKKGIWICKRCRFCNVCGRPGDLLECKRCTKTYHSACLGPSYPTKPSKNRVWVCMRCVRCRSCGASRPGRRPGSKWTHDFQLCQRCGDLFDKGNFCPICRRCYRDEDYESRMVQCATCKRWVHSRCESLTIEMYTLLSHLPDDVQYVCPDCDGRRCKVELELSHSDTVLTDESGNDSLEGDKMRGLLCKLPAPSWKKILENEIQSGIETVMMALFHNKEAACILKKSAVEEESGRPVDLFAIRFAVHNRRYTSVAEFSSDVCYILDTVAGNEMADMIVQSESRRKKRTNVGARGAFCKEMHNVFPWFDVYTGRVRDSSDVPEDLLPHATLPPYSDHNYAQWQDRDIDLSAGGPDTPLKTFVSGTPSGSNSIGTVIWTLSPRKEFEDMRQCLFCGKYGDDNPTNAGRLVYCGQDEWVHVNCALWSAEVFERHDGSLQNVYSAVSRGRMMKCDLCKLPGATVGCNTRDCPKNYHFVCAKLAGCSFQDDKKVFCARHVRNVDSELVPEEGFEIARRVVVDNDDLRPNKRWQRGVHSHDMTVLLGSAIIHQLGHLSTSSDSKDYLIPVNFRMTRMFWSTVHAGRRVRYTITVTEQKSSLDGPANLERFISDRDKKIEQHENHTISHADDDKPLNLTMPKKSRYLGAEACRSKLLDRLDGNRPGPLPRRKSYDESVIPHIPRPDRIPNSHYTVVGSCNRTLPQAITPLPTISRSANTFQRLLPTVSESSNVNSNLPNPSPVEPQESTAPLNMKIDDVVPISAQNPFLITGLEDCKDENVSIETSCPSTAIESAPTTSVSKESVFTIPEQNLTKTTPVISKPPKIAISLIQPLPLISESQTVTSDVGSIKSGVSGSIVSQFGKESEILQPLGDDVPDKLPTPSSAERIAVEAAQPSHTGDKVTTGSGQMPDKPVLEAIVNEKRNPNVLKDMPEQETLSKLSRIPPESEKALKPTPLLDSMLLTSPKTPDLSSSDKRPQTPTQMELRVRIERLESSPHIKTFLQKNTGHKQQNETTNSIPAPTSVGLLQQAKDAADRELVPKSAILAKSIESASLWWKKVKVEKKRSKSVGHERQGRKPLRSDSQKAKKKILKDSDDFIVSGDDDEELEPRTIQTRSRARSTSTTVITKSQIMDETKPIPDDEPSTKNECGNFPKRSQKNLEQKGDDLPMSCHEEGKKFSDEGKQSPNNDIIDISNSKSSDGAKINSPSSGEESRSQEINQSHEKDTTGIQSPKSLENDKDAPPSCKDDKKIASGETVQSQENCIVSHMSPESSESDSLLYDCSHDRTSSRESILDDSSVSGESNIVLTKGPPNLRSASLRKFARNQSINESSQNSVEKLKKNQKILKFLPTRLRHFSHESSPWNPEKEEEKIVCNGVSHDADPKSKSQKLPVKSTRARSKSVDLSAKKKKTSEKVHSDIEGEISPRRYPRRNPFTCLGSFSGLSPNYAIQSYSWKSQDRDERATTRLLKRDKKQPKGKSASLSPSKNKRSRSRSSSGNSVTSRCKAQTKDAVTDAISCEISKKNSSEDDNCDEKSEQNKSSAKLADLDDNLGSDLVKKCGNVINVDQALAALDTNLVLKSNPVQYDSTADVRPSRREADSPVSIPVRAALSSNKADTSTTDVGPSRRETGSPVAIPVQPALSSNKADTCAIRKFDSKTSKISENCQAQKAIKTCSQSGELQESVSSGNSGTGIHQAQKAIKARSQSSELQDSVSSGNSGTGIHQAQKTIKARSQSSELQDSVSSGNSGTGIHQAQKAIKARSQSSELQDFVSSCNPGTGIPVLQHSTPAKVSEQSCRSPRQNNCSKDEEFDQRTPEKIVENLNDDKTLSLAPPQADHESASLAESQVTSPSESPQQDQSPSVMPQKNADESCVTCISMPAEKHPEQASAINTSISTFAENTISVPNIAEECYPPIEITRGIIEESKAADTIPVIIEPDLACVDDKVIHPQTLPLNPAPTSPVAVNSLPPLEEPQGRITSGGFNTATEDIESPLSPRDEPRLPLPVETESFLVTSECPVLNADEVQSLLAMPSTMTTSSTPVFTQSAPVPTPAVSQLQYFQIQQRYAMVTTVPQQSMVTYPIQQNVPVLPLNCGASGTLLMYTQQASNVTQQQNSVVAMATDTTGTPFAIKIAGESARFTQQPVVVPTTPKPTVMNYQYVQPQIQMVYQTPVGHAAAPTPTYIATPVMNTHQNPVYGTQQTYRFVNNAMGAAPVAKPSIQYATPSQNVSNATAAVWKTKSSVVARATPTPNFGNAKATTRVTKPSIQYATPTQNVSNAMAATPVMKPSIQYDTPMQNASNAISAAAASKPSIQYATPTQNASNPMAAAPVMKPSIQYATPTQNVSNAMVAAPVMKPSIQYVTPMQNVSNAMSAAAATKPLIQYATPTQNVSNAMAAAQVTKPSIQYATPTQNVSNAMAAAQATKPSIQYATPTQNISNAMAPTRVTKSSFRYPTATHTPRSMIPKPKQKRKNPQTPPVRRTSPQNLTPKITPSPRQVTNPTTGVEDVALTPDQAQTLERMIEFYSNKNQLSPSEKQIVRTIIAQQIKNKSLPLPPQESTSPASSSDISKEQCRVPMPGILTGQKRKLSAEKLTEPMVKRMKKTKRKEEHKPKEQQHPFSSEKRLCDKFDSVTRSPLLDVYMSAVHAENTADDKLVKKWRESVRHLSKHNIFLDVPWHSRKGQRDKENRLPPPPQTSKRSHLLYEIKSEDGYYAKGPDLQELVSNLLDAVQERRANSCIPPTSLCLASILSSHAFLGVSHDVIRFLVEQLPGARHCLRYRAKYHKHREPLAEVVTHINPHGCARAEKYQGRSKPDMFSFLASKHRVPPSYNPSRTQNVDMQQNSTRRPTSMDLPMAMRFRHLKTSAREAVGVYRSAIHGRGLYCKRDIEAGEMVMEYTGEVIRCFLTDHREKMYEKKGIGCYMFRMDDMYVVDATMLGSGARFINHSCEPSCYSRIVSIDGKKHIIIFALRKILRGEELTYDYKFPIEAEDQKIMCNCGAKTCRKYMN